MIKIEKLMTYIIPSHKQARLLPYGNLMVSDGKVNKVVKIIEDRKGQYFTFNRKRYYVRQFGAPEFVIVGSIEDVAERLKEAGYKYEIQNDTSLRVYYKDNGNYYTQITLCDESREDYYTIEGRVQNLTEWIEKGF